MKSDPLENYNWEDDNGWQVLWSKVDQDTLQNKTAQSRQKWIKKKKVRYYKEHVDPEYVPPPTPKNSPAPKPADKPAEAPQNPPEKKEEKEKEQPKPEPKAADKPKPKPKKAWTPKMSWWFYLAMHTVILLGTPLVVLMPKLGMRMVTFGNFLLYGYYLKELHGRPQWNAEYAQAMITDENSYHLFWTFVLLMSNPSVMWCLPTFFRSLVLATGQYKAFLYYFVPALFPYAKGMIKKVEARKPHLTNFANTIEVYLGVFGIPGALILKTTSFAQLGCVWQFLRMKYMVIGKTQMAFRQFNASIRPKMPGAVVGYWDWLTNKLHGMANAQQQQGASRSGCSVM